MKSHTKKRQELKKYTITFWILFLLFVLRVFGQILVEFFHVDFLPPSEFWMAGIVSYPVLLALQILVIILLSKILVDFSRGYGYFVEKSKWKKGWLYFGIFYFLIMIVRYLVFGISIPVVFHWVLATFCILLGIYYLKENSR